VEHVDINNIRPLTDFKNNMKEYLKELNEVVDFIEQNILAKTRS